MKCLMCPKKFREGDHLVPVVRYITNEKRGDFVSSPVGYIHLHCIRGEG